MKPSAANKLDSENPSHDEEGYHVIGLLNRPFPDLIISILECSWQGHHVYGIARFTQSRDRVKIFQQWHPQKGSFHYLLVINVISGTAQSILRVRLEFISQIILPSNIFRTNYFVECFALRLVHFESQKEKKLCTYQQGKGQWTFRDISWNRFGINTLMILQIPFSKPTSFELKFLTAEHVPLV